jgi:hypothetical protein
MGEGGYHYHHYHHQKPPRSPYLTVQNHHDCRSITQLLPPSVIINNYNQQNHTCHDLFITTKTPSFAAIHHL